MTALAEPENQVESCVEVGDLDGDGAGDYHEHGAPALSFAHALHRVPQ